MAKITAVIDIGSNSITLKIYKKTSRLAYYELKRVKYKIRIGEGSYENGGVLQKKPMDRAYEAIKDFSYIIRAYKTRKTLCIATSALRDAPNKKEFIKRVDTDLKIKIKVIDGERESFFGGLSAINLLPNMKSFVSVDIGGGSTEFAKIENGKIVKTLSLQLGHVRLNEMFKSDDEKSLYINKELEKLGDDFISEVVVGIGGSARELAKYLQKKLHYPLSSLHGYSVEFCEAKGELEKLKDYDEQKLKKYISKSRVDTIKDGDMVLLNILEQLKCEKFIINQKGVREGVYLKDLLRSFNFVFPSNFDLNLKVIEDRFILTKKENNFVKKFSLRMYDNICEEKRYRDIISFCVKVMNILDFNFNFWIDYLEFRISHEDKVLIAYLMECFNSGDLDEKLYEKYIVLLPPFKIIKQLFFILQISEIVGKNMLIQRFNIVKDGKNLNIELDYISFINKSEIESLENPTKYKIKVKSGRKSL